MAVMIDIEPILKRYEKLISDVEVNDLSPVDISKNVR